MKNKIKYMTATLLVLMILMAILSGCKQDEGEKGTGKGRYVEEDMELPITEGREQFVSLSNSKDDTPLIFAINYPEAKIIRYEYKDKRWEQSTVHWFTEMYESKMPAECTVKDIKEGNDSTQVVVMSELSGRDYLIRGKDGNKGEELQIPYLSEKTESGFYPSIYELLIDGKGNYWLDVESSIMVFSHDTFNKSLEIETSMKISDSGKQRKIMGAGQDGNIAVHTEEGRYTVYDAFSLEEIGVLKLKDEEWTQLCSDGDNWYSISKTGIVRSQPENNINEVIMDGGTGEMGSPLKSAVSITRGSEEDFFVVYENINTLKHSLRHYVYDPNMPAVPENTLTVFSLSENKTVRQAITDYQRKNPNIQVKFTTSGKSENEVTTDDIRTLNTELLSGNGADILLMDGLPIESYIEKGMLADLTELTEELTNENSYIKNIMNHTAQKDGKIYGLPLKFNVPVMYGDKMVQKALESIDTLKVYLETHPDAPVFGVADYGYIRNFLFFLYQDEVVDSDGKVNQENLTVLLELIKKIGVNSKAEDYDEQSGNDYLAMTNTSKLFDNGMSAGIGILKFPESVGSAEVYSVFNMVIPYALMQELNVTPVSIKNTYNPIGITAINQNSRQKELAEEFIKYLLSEDGQSTQVGEGFPVLESELEKQAEEVTSKSTRTSGWGFALEIEGETLEFFPMPGTIIKTKDVKDLIAMSHTLSNPLRQDRVVWGIYWEIADKYLEGSIDAEEAAKTIAQKVDTYLAE